LTQLNFDLKPQRNARKVADNPDESQICRGHKTALSLSQRLFLYRSKHRQALRSLHLFENKNWNDIFRAPGGFPQRRVVRNAQVATEPMNDPFHA
jgi:hypothetical protein